MGWWLGSVGGLVDWWLVGLVGMGLPLLVYDFLFTTFCRWVGLVGGLVGRLVG